MTLLAHHIAPCAPHAHAIIIAIALLRVLRTQPMMCKYEFIDWHLYLL
jgi:hypothetical protein